MTTLSVVEKVATLQLTIKDNFQVLDFCIRRYYNEICYLFPTIRHCNYNENVVNIVKKPFFEHNSLEIWNNIFGEDCKIVSFDKFMEKVQPHLQLTEKGLTYFSFCVNFTKDDIMTPYRFQSACHQFGPWSELGNNFENIVLHPPFVGLLNAETAKKFLIPSTYLIRFSQATPEALTLSYCVYDQANEVYRNIRATNKTIKTVIADLLIARPYMVPCNYHFNSVKYASEGILNYINTSCNVGAIS